jgi:hypothetical protein
MKSSALQLDYGESYDDLLPEFENYSTADNLPPIREPRKGFVRGEKSTLGLLMSVLVLITRLASPAVGAGTPRDDKGASRKDLVSAVKHLEKKLGFRRTKNFHTESAESAVAYRCYYTGKLELPASYEKLQLLQGTKAGCPLDAQKFDVFFYPLEAEGSGKSPVSASLERESTERFLFVVPHEDFHANKELRKLPATWSEASAMLVGLLTAAEVARQKFGENSQVYQNLQLEPELFNRKAEIVNRYYAQLSQLYAAAHAGEIPELEALTQKQEAFAEIHQACTAISPNPKSFKRCLAADNNAGLAFDETYTKYYPLMFRLYLKENRALKPTVDALQRVMDANSDQEAFQNLKKEVMSAE